jgi:hypothetical protein
VDLSHFNEQQLELFISAIQSVETGGEKDPLNAVGDRGELGPFQITLPYFMDSGVVGDYPEICTTINGSIEVMLCYWERYASTKPSLEELARIHNGGPKGAYKESTKSYWMKVSERMAELNPNQGRLF